MTSPQSPDYVRLSLAAAMALQYRGGWFYRDARPKCINLLMTYDNGCGANCAYCGLARQREGEFVDKSFIRVEWPTVALSDAVARMHRREDRLERVCVSMVTRKEAVADLKDMVLRIRAGTSLPISLLLSPTALSRTDLVDLSEAGAERVGIAIDSSTEELFEKHRGTGVGGPHRWERYWQTLADAVEVFGERRAGCHLIVGLGETEQEMVSAFLRVRKLGAVTHLFSFYPECGSALADRPQAPVGQYRRMQLARFLVDAGIADKDNFVFDENGRLRELRIPSELLEPTIESGKPFMTSGCPNAQGEVACTRPYGDSPPGPGLRSYPFQPDEDDMKAIREQLWM